MYHFHIHKKHRKNGIITFRVSIVVRRFAELPRIKKNQSQLGDFVASLVLLVCLAQCTKTPIVCIDADLRRQSCCGRESLGVCFNQINRPQKLIQKYINSKTQTQIILFWKGKFQVSLLTKLVNIRCQTITNTNRSTKVHRNRYKKILLWRGKFQVSVLTKLVNIRCLPILTDI